MTRRIMLVDLDAFFVSVEQILNPALKVKPVIVGGSPDRRGVVASGSYEARKFGIHAGMPLRSAQRLCPQAIFVEGNFANYRDYSQKFMNILADFTPELEAAGLDEAYLDVTGFESLHGSIYEMAMKLKTRLKNETGLIASIGIAGGKSIAKVASEKSKPAGLLEVPAGAERDFLAPLSVGDLPGIGQKSEQILKGLGISTIGQLAGVSASLLKSRFGVWGELMQQRARGIDESKVETRGAAKSISRETTFAEDTRDISFLKATLRYLGERVGAELRESGKQTHCITIKLRYADFTTAILLTDVACAFTILLHGVSILLVRLKTYFGQE
jgi:DNA polymerase-4